MATHTYISEVFSSIQGEGRYLGYKQVFIRLAGCTFDCPYCDTDFSAGQAFTVGKQSILNPVDSELLSETVFNEFDPSFIHSYSFTGGEPLLSPDFLEECAISLKKKSGKRMFLETSGLIVDALARFDGLMDIMSVDIKTHSIQVLENFEYLMNTLSKLKFSEFYLKLILPDNFSYNSIKKVCDSLIYYGVKELIVQPVDNIIKPENIDLIFEMFYKHNIEIRLIPQSHKLLGIR